MKGNENHCLLGIAPTFVPSVKSMCTFFENTPHYPFHLHIIFLLYSISIPILISQCLPPLKNHL